jgi:Fic family protein
MESIGSARIEGNNTTLAEYIESKFETHSSGQSIIEIGNMEKTLSFIDSDVNSNSSSMITRAFISELHKGVVLHLPQPPDGEGDKTPGKYREHSVTIARSKHIPPTTKHQIEEYMGELINFINRDDPPKYDLLKTALVHHRFMWIHPFGNGNGRTGRLLTYAMLVKQGFAVSQGHIVNPTAVFCIDRNDYYEHLSRADNGDDNGILSWCHYVLGGLKKEIEKIDKLLNYEYLRNEIVKPALRWSLNRQLITELEFRILQMAVDKPDQLIQAADVRKLVPEKRAEFVSRIIRDLLKRNMLATKAPRERKYHLRFDNNYLLRGVIQMLSEKGFLAIKNDI